MNLADALVTTPYKAGEVIIKQVHIIRSLIIHNTCFLNLITFLSSRSFVLDWQFILEKYHVSEQFDCAATYLTNNVLNKIKNSS